MKTKEVDEKKIAREAVRKFSEHMETIIPQRLKLKLCHSMEWISEKWLKENNLL